MQLACKEEDRTQGLDLNQGCVSRNVETLAASSFNRASLGVQDFDPKLQKTIDRI